MYIIHFLVLGQKVSKISPTIGSWKGGLKLTIEGEGIYS